MEDRDIEAACIEERLSALAEEYIAFCKNTAECEKKTSKRGGGRFPNVAGFCRYFSIGASEYECLAQKYPAEFERLSVAFEDEALNSDVSPTILSAYLKKRLGYDRESEREISDGQLNILFDHNIMEDGE
ncbi:MAG: hypothetical protein J6V42_00490 [Clostridia bacterium]|nr:hypothetical protein [Clostridia bacterium]